MIRDCIHCGKPLADLQSKQGRYSCGRDSCMRARHENRDILKETRERASEWDVLVRARKAAGRTWFWR